MSDARTVIAKAIRDNTRIERSLSLSDDILAALAEAGLVIVPREPTGKMALAASEFDANSSDTMRQVWRAMVGAANEQ